ncbi:MAG: transcriptional repressor [Tannerellaceae bacterium]|jgi:Fur family ferric uptake transcriptional regulator|nr:transcriptional repressor [Tannerellaceae bacterium]
MAGMIDNKIYKEIRDSFSAYLTEKKLRKTEERYTILDEVCAFPGHFDTCMLHRKLSDTKYHVSRATLYNTLEVLMDAGLLIRHQINSKSVQYELRKKAETHLHFICTQCNCMREIKHPPTLIDNVNSLKNSITPEYFSLYVYGMCGRCKNKAQRKAQKINQSYSNNKKK